ncbi:MAG: hypothetical protein IJX02_05265 [Clostridia bacterium]|nr:hypothetical protein [Clostridia bacterium]
MNESFDNELKPKDSKLLGALCLAAGILSIVICCFFEWVGLIFGIIGIVLFIINRIVNGKQNGLAIGGLVCAIIGVVLSTVAIIIVLAMKDFILELEAELAKVGYNVNMI